MSILLGLLGIALVVFVLYDALLTTLAVHMSAGPLTGRVSAWLWRAMIRHHRASPSHGLLSLAGIAIFLAIFVMWGVLILLGWSLIFSMGEGAIVDTQSGEPADFWSRVYFAGFALLTLGVGDYRPVSAPWQLATIAAAANGFFLITLAISYLAPVVSAATRMRQLAAYITSLGATPYELLLNAWDGKGFSSLTHHFISLASALALYGHHYLAYPVLPYFHSGKRRASAAVNIAVLYEALILLEHGVPAQHQPDRLALRSLRFTLSEFLETLDDTFIAPAEEVPFQPGLELLRARGIPTVSDEAFAAAIEGCARQRRLVADLVGNDGWSWDELYG